jgi:hypothetical protein
MEDAALTSMLDDLLMAESGPNTGILGSEGPNDLVEKMALLPNEHYDYVLVLARTTHEWQELCYKLGIQKVRFPDRKRAVGVGRAITAEKLLGLLSKSEVVSDGDYPEGFGSDGVDSIKEIDKQPESSLDAKENDLFDFGFTE